jgi:hypothetical protein
LNETRNRHEAGSKRSSETSVDFQETTRRYIPQDRPLPDHRCENVKSYIPDILVKEISLIILCDMRTLEEVLTMVYNTQNYWVFGPFPSSGIVENRKHDVSKTGSVSVLR